MERVEQEAQLSLSPRCLPVTTGGVASSVEGSRGAEDRVFQGFHFQMAPRRERWSLGRYPDVSTHRSVRGLATVSHGPHGRGGVFHSPHLPLSQPC